jgi:hypothetical protein
MANSSTGTQRGSFDVSAFAQSEAAHALLADEAAYPGFVETSGLAAVLDRQ